ncbi:MAG: ABC-F family ATP-binding cassette domain-containing protein [SAR202 cluster bacterium]|nr:ABC-F family ATP-binding cassette domain-containing protein [SAR202 cluster bacterium]
MAILSTSKLHLHYGDIPILSNINLDINKRSRIGLVGANGTGKTSLVKILVGETDFQQGELLLQKNLSIGYVPQTAEDIKSSSVKAHIMHVFQNILDLEHEIEDSSKTLENNNNPTTQNTHLNLLHEYEMIGGYRYITEFNKTVTGLNLTLDVLENSFNSASGGERTKANLAKALLQKPDLLILDEPTNYLDFESLRWLEDFINHYESAVLVVSHDRHFLDQVTTSIWELENQSITTYPGNYTKYKKLKAEFILRQQKEYDSQKAFIEKEQAFIDKYRAGQKSRQAHGRETRLNRIQLLQAPNKTQSINLPDLETKRTGRVILSTHEANVGFIEKNKETVLLTVSDIELLRGTKTAFVGKNGIGKTTFLKTIVGEIPSLNGIINFGHQISYGYVDQNLSFIPENVDVLTAFLDAKNIPINEARSYLARFLFIGEQVFQNVDSLSGGQLTRLQIARTMIQNPNFLILDEPTTHLDIQSREAMEIVLQNYEGAILFVSHDRLFINNIAEQLLIVENNQINLFKGTFNQWEEITNKSNIKKGKNTNQNNKNKSKKINKYKFEQQENLIKDLEKKLKNLEIKLNNATKTQNISELTEFGQQYTLIEKQLSDELEKWVNF